MGRYVVMNLTELNEESYVTGRFVATGVDGIFFYKVLIVRLGCIYLGIDLFFPCFRDHSDRCILYFLFTDGFCGFLFFYCIHKIRSL